MNINKSALYISLVAAVALVVSVFILASGLRDFRSKGAKTITVTGKAERNFQSDLIVWSASFTAESANLPSAYSELKEKQQAVTTFLNGKNIPSDAISYSSVSISRENESYYDSTVERTFYRFKGYSLTQTVTITSRNIEAVSRQISELINKGIEIESGSPRYYYTKLNDLKIEMLKEASEDAYNRAGVIAEGSKSSLGKLDRSSMGVFQIVGLNSDEDYSWGGSFNTSSKMKTASITVSATYSIK
mgnify:CR=1 FL=1